MSQSPMKLQFKLGQCVSDVLDDANLKDPDAIVAWVQDCITRARLTIRAADRAARERRKDHA